VAGLISELLELLKVQYENITDLTELSKEKKDVIIANDIEQLQKIVDIESILTRNNLKTEKTRDAIFHDISDVLNVSYEGMTLKKLASTIKNKEHSMELNTLSEKITTRLKELKSINDQNKILLQTAVEYTEFTINALRGAITGEISYVDSSGSEIEATKMVFDTKQ
jgi:flagellar biosynthesis/type III secretory pathway chaperone